MRVQLAGVSKSFGAQLVLDNVTLTLGPRSRLGLVGPNGAGKSTLLRILAGLEDVDAGTVATDPDDVTVGFLPQEPALETADTVLGYLARRTGVEEADQELAASTLALGADPRLHDRYDRALARFLALGGSDFEARARATCARLGVRATLRVRPAELSGGEAARIALASILLARYDALLLDEPTNDLDDDGLETLGRFVDGYRGAVVVVSHDRAFLDQVVTRIAAIEAGSTSIREFAGGWSAYDAARELDRRAGYARFERVDRQRRRADELLSKRRDEARAGGAKADRRGTRALSSKVRQAERLTERSEEATKPFEPWELQLVLAGGPRPGETIAALEGVVVERGSFRLGPVDLHLAGSERVAVRGRNGSGKSTLLGALTGELPLHSGRRVVGPSTSIGSIGQTRSAYTGGVELLGGFVDRTRLTPQDARTLLAKFGLGSEHVFRRSDRLSPGERTRAQLAELQASSVNLLVLDEPTNHLDLEAVEQLETALRQYQGTLVVVSHDRRFLERIEPTRELVLDAGVSRRAP